MTVPFQRPFKPRLKLSNETPVTVAEHLRQLSLSTQRASTWWAAEVKKLIPIALQQERITANAFVLGLLIGVAVGAIVATILL